MPTDDEKAKREEELRKAQEARDESLTRYERQNADARLAVQRELQQLAEWYKKRNELQGKVNNGN